MYLVVIGWLYVVVMMAVAEASNPSGTVIGAIVTFFLYGLMPVALVVYLMRTPQRRKEIKAREAAESKVQVSSGGSVDGDASGHSASGAEADSVAPVRKEP